MLTNLFVMASSDCTTLYQMKACGNEKGPFSRMLRMLPAL